MSQNHNIIRAAEDLIQEQFELEPSLEQVVWIDTEKTTEIRLLEINPETPPIESVLSFYFPPYSIFSSSPDSPALPCTLLSNCGCRCKS